MTNAYEDYVAALRDLDHIRNTQVDAAAARQARSQHTGSVVDELEQRVARQRQGLRELASDCEFPPPATQPPAHPPAPPLTNGAPGDANAEVNAAAADVEEADKHLTDAVYLAHRPKLLPRWRADERNGLIYGICALLSMLAQLGVLMFASSVDTFADAFGHIVLCGVLPFVGWIAGWATIGAVSRPVLGQAHIGHDGKVSRHWRLGLLICLSTWLVTCWLGSLFLN